MIAGLRVGHATDASLKSGVTAILVDEPAVAAMHVGGAAPATAETDLLRPGNLVERVDAILLSGGSAFGLAAADGARAWLVGQGRGFVVRDIAVPIVPAAALFDLANGGDKSPISRSGGAVYRDLGFAACEAGDHAGIGSVGAGSGATTADLKGGFGIAEDVTSEGFHVAAFAAVNAVGQATLGPRPHFRAAPFERDREFGGVGYPFPLPTDAGRITTKSGARPGENTTLVIIATDCALARSEAKRLAVAAHDGIALAIFPAHTPFDGDISFALSTGRSSTASGPRTLLELCAAATTTLARAIAIGVFSAAPAEGDVTPAWASRYGRDHLATTPR
jgi:L-aminopeptidase/D-esterase-like protein